MSQRPASRKPPEAKGPSKKAASSSRPKRSGSATGDSTTSSGKSVEKAKLTRSGSGYENVPPGKARPGDEKSETYTPTYVNLGGTATTSAASKSPPRPLKAHFSDPIIHAPLSLQTSQRPTNGYDNVELKKRAGTEVSSDALSFTKASFLMPGIETAKDCQQCQELSHLNSLWQLGVSGLARNYSRILAQLTKAREASIRLESKVREREQVQAMRRHPHTSNQPTSNLAGDISTKAESPKLKRYSMYSTGADPTVSLPVGGMPHPESNITQQMYPDSQETCALQSLPDSYAKELTELNTHLGKAIDLCQQLAAASFKTNQSIPQGHPSGVGSTATALKPKSGKKTLERMSSQPLKPVTPVASPSAYRPTLGSISEDNPSGTLKRKYGGGDSGGNTVAAASSGADGLSNGLEHGDSDSDSEDEEGGGEKVKFEGKTSHQPVFAQEATDGTTLPTASSSASQGATSNFESSTPSQKPFRSHMMSLIAAEENMRPIAPSFVLMDSMEYRGPEGEDSSGIDAADDRRESILSRASTFSDGDVKQVMSKIASLEEERIKLMETIDKMQQDNQMVRLSLYETMGDLENKDLQLTLAMQDLTIATGEIRNAADMRQRLQNLHQEREALMDRLSSLEDESAAVKVSLIQLLQQKSATNKTLALENWRLSQKMKVLAISPSPGNTLRRRPSGGQAEGDNISLSSNISTAEIDATLQETYLGLDDAGCFVHKQGFLTKQGGKVKNWKRRLFVLDSEGISYFKTEQPIQRIPLSRIQGVEVAHGRTAYPHMFEVHTKDRVFFLSAPTGDEMQSWVGMLQTLMQYNRNRQQQSRLQLSLQHTAATSMGVSRAEGNGLPQRPLSEASLDSRVLLEPSLPGLEDEEEDIEQLLRSANGESRGKSQRQDSARQFSRSVPTSPAGFIEESTTVGSSNLWHT